MSKSKLVTGFPRYRDTELETKARFIVESMSDNPHFTTPVPSLAEITNSINAYTGALRDAEAGGKALIAKKNEERALLIALLEKLSLYVEAYSNNNEVILLSSGFSLAKTRSTIGSLPKPHNFSVSPTTAGVVVLKLETIYGADSYQYEYRLANVESTWSIETFTKASLKLKGLQSGQKYEFRVAGIGAHPDRVYSDTISTFVI